jgi:hypothetical protein
VIEPDITAHNEGRWRTERATQHVHSHRPATFIALLEITNGAAGVGQRRATGEARDEAMKRQTMIVPMLGARVSGSWNRAIMNHETR